LARKPTLSPSKFTTFLACPTKYYWTYLDPRGKWYLRSKNYYSFGTTLHLVLQRFHDSNDTGVTTVEEAVAAVEDSWIDAGYSSAQEMQEALGEGKSIIEAYVERVQAQPVAATTIFFEKLLRKDQGDWVLTGRVDRVDEHPDGTIEVVDYKSRRQGVTSEEIASDLAMSVYQVLLKEQFPDRPVRATILALRTGVSATASLDDSQREEFENDLRALAREILDRDFTGHEPTPKALCASCDFLALCSKEPKFQADYEAWLDSNKREILEEDS